MSLDPKDPRAHALTVEAYRAALAAHDWFYEYSADHGVWGEGRNSAARIARQQKAVDPDYAVWNEVAPPQFRRSVEVKS